MGNRQSTPSSSCDLICGRGQPITTIASLCARWLLPAGGERERNEGGGGGKLEKVHDKWMERVKSESKGEMTKSEEKGEGWGGGKK